MKTYGISTTEEDYKTLKEFFGKIQIRVNHGCDNLYVYNEFLNKKIFYSCNPFLIAQQIREGKITNKTKEDWPKRWQ